MLRFFNFKIDHITTKKSEDHIFTESQTKETSGHIYMGKLSQHHIILHQDKQEAHIL